MQRELHSYVDRVLYEVVSSAANNSSHVFTMGSRPIRGAECFRVTAPLILVDAEKGKREQTMGSAVVFSATLCSPCSSPYASLAHASTSTMYICRVRDKAAECHDHTIRSRW